MNGPMPGDSPLPKKKETRGRKPWISEAVIRNIVTGVQAGEPYYRCARVSGIAADTMDKWLTKGRRALARFGVAPVNWPDDQEPPPDLRHIPEEFRLYARLARDVSVATVMAEMYPLSIVQDAMRGPDKRLAVETAKWFLERRYPRRWGGQRALPGGSANPNQPPSVDDEPVVFRLSIPDAPRLMAAAKEAAVRNGPAPEAAEIPETAPSAG